MRKRSLNRDLPREIRRTFSRFLSILLLITIAVCFLFGLRMAAPDMEASMDGYLDDRKLMDVHILSTMGLTQEDVDAAAQLPGTADAEGEYAADALVSSDSGREAVAVRVISSSDRINIPELTAGRMPSGEDECLVEQKLLSTLGLSIGDAIVLDTGTGSFAGALKSRELTVVGTAMNPLYISVTRGTSTLGNGSVVGIVTVAPEAFDLDYFTDIYIRVADADSLNAYSDDYADAVSAYTDRLEQIRPAREQARTAQLRRDAQTALNHSWQANPEGQQKLADARKRMDNIPDARWYILDRNANMGFASFEQDASRMNKLAALFPTVFFLVAALVCLNAMTRMVEDQRVQIGGLKALGYSRADIARKYVGYGLLASLAGSVLGLALGATAIPYVIVSCWKILYTFPGASLDFDWGTAAVCVAAAVACCTAAVLVAALRALGAAPAALMRPRAPEPGKRIWLERIAPVWKRMSFSQKVTARNLFRYQKRFWMTVIGIAGCTALMVTGFGLHDSFMDVIDLQFGKISTYSAMAYLDTDADQLASVYTLLEQTGEVEQFAPMYFSSVTLESGSDSVSGSLLAAEAPEDFAPFWHFRDRKTGNPVVLEQDGALITEKTAQLLGIGVGDSVTVVTGDDRAAVPIAGVVENYVQNYVFLTKDCYAAAFGQRPSDNELLLKCAEGSDPQALGGRLLQQDAVSGVYYQSESLELLRTQMEGINPAVLIIISAAAALAFVVLYNLSSINITERKRELATLRVLGFRDREMRSYVFRENLVLTLIGMVFGAVLGKYFHAYLITTVEIELVMFGRRAHLTSYLLALLLTLVFALLVNETAGRTLTKIDMVESLKTVE